MKQRRSNSTSTCTLPTIPEYPGFQDFKLSRNYLEAPAFNRRFQELGREKRSSSSSSSSQLNSFPNRPSLIHCLGTSSRSPGKGHPVTSSGFQDKPLQEYFNERLMELRNYDSKRSNKQTKIFADKNPNPFLTPRGSRCRSSCGAVSGHGKGRAESCGSAHPESTKVMGCNHQEETQNVLDLYKGDFLDFLTLHITAPLEAFVQKK